MFEHDVGMRWVVVHTELGERVRRYEVPGGWLYQVETGNFDEDGMALWHAPVFIPEPTEKPRG